MRKQIFSRSTIFLYCYLLILALDLLAVTVLYDDRLRWVTKSALMPLLACYFLSHVFSNFSKRYIAILAALFFSWLGDIFLLLEGNNTNNFLFGLSAFLIAHIAYIVFFQRVRKIEAVKPRPLVIGLIIVYYVSLIYLLSPHLGDLAWPVRVYGIIISLMLMLAFHMLYVPEATAGLWMAIGAALFIASDSVLAINKFYNPFEPAGFIVMATYGIAQLLIVDGARRYILYRYQ